MKVMIEIPDGKYCEGCNFNSLGKENDNFIQVCRFYYGRKLKVEGNHTIKDDGCPLLMNESMSDAMKLIKHAWDCVLKTKPFSDYRVTSTMHEALTLAIKAGLKFAKDDCKKIADLCELGSGYYCQQFLSFDDRYYSVAVSAGNVSACQAFELHNNFKPFIMHGVDAPDVNVAGKKHGTNSTNRIAVGSKFNWNNESVTVTSFAKDYSHFVACSYKPREYEKACSSCGRGGWSTGEVKVNRLYKITHDDLKAIKNKTDEVNKNATDNSLS